MENNHLTETRFSDFALQAEIIQSLDAAQFTFCTPIQAEVLPHTCQNKDVAGQAQTGTGKTGAFLVSVFQYLLSHPQKKRSHTVRCLCLAPTRELAIQIANDAKLLGKHTGLNIALVYGGAAYNAQKAQFNQPVDILIGTPGRAIDYWKQRAYTLRYAQALILDEADRMFDMGFIKDIRYLLRQLPPAHQRLNMLFSATLSGRVMELSYEHMNNPIKVEIKADKVNSDTIKQTVFYPANNEKMALLIGLMQKYQPFRSIVFVNTKRDAENIDDYMRGNDITAAMISGDVRQNKRQRLLQEFEDSKYQVLIATDVAARGLHIPDITHVFNYSLPQIAEDYVHRIGRTARAGASGEAFSFACEDSAFYLPDIETYIDARIPMEQVSADLLPELKTPRRIKRDRSPYNSKNKSTPNKTRNTNWKKKPKNNWKSKPKISPKKTS
jgi:ATP-dependent RNA helicase RhlB